MSPRVAPPMIGLGLLEAVARGGHPGPCRSGRCRSRRHLRAAEPGLERRATGQVMLGRFGWKAGEPRSISRAATRMAGDIGIGNPIAPAAWGDCTAAAGRLPRGAERQQPRSTTDLEAPGRSWPRSCSTPATWRCRRAAPRTTRPCSGQAAVLPVGLHRLPSAQARDPARLGGRGARRPADLALQRPAAARHGRGSGRPPARGRGRAAGNGARRRSGASASPRGQRPHLLPARRPGPQPDRGDPLARRRGRSGAREPSPPCPRPSATRCSRSWARYKPGSMRASLRPDAPAGVRATASARARRDVLEDPQPAAHRKRPDPRATSASPKSRRGSRARCRRFLRGAGCGASGRRPRQASRPRCWPGSRCSRSCSGRRARAARTTVIQLFPDRRDAISRQLSQGARGAWTRRWSRRAGSRARAWR